MSQENVETVTRHPLAVTQRTRRHWEERLGLRFPRFVPPLARALWRLPPGSRLRKALIRRFLRFAFEAINRRDHEAGVMLYHPEGEFDPPAQVAGLGLASHTVGPGERVRLRDRWREEWEGFRVEPTEVIIAGDRVIALVRFEAVGLISGAATGIEGAFVVTISKGRVVSEQAFVDQAEALEAAGLSE